MGQRVYWVVASVKGAHIEAKITDYLVNFIRESPIPKSSG